MNLKYATYTPIHCTLHVQYLHTCMVDQCAVPENINTPPTEGIFLGGGKF